MTILVTGGAGFIGTNFVYDWLAHHDEPVVNLDKLSYSGNLENLAPLAGHAAHHFVCGDIGDEILVGELLSGHQPRAVLNFAAESHVDRSISGPAAFVQTNVVGVFNLLQAVRGYWEGLDGEARAGFRLLHISTDEVYGTLDRDEPAFTEATPARPNSPYSATKAAADHLVRAWHRTYGLPVLTTNCSNNYGPFQFPEKLIPLVIANALNGDELPVYGDGLQVRDWLFVTDHCAALRAVLERGRPGEVYNIGGDSELTNLATVQAICDGLDRLHPRADGQSYRAQIVHVADRPGHDRRYAVDSSKIRTEMGWAPVQSFAGGLERTIEWYLGHRDWTAHVMDGSYRDWIKTHYAVG